MVSKDQTNNTRTELNDRKEDAEEVVDLEQPRQSSPGSNYGIDNVSSNESNSNHFSSYQVLMSRIIVISVHLAFMAIATLLESSFVFDWSGESNGVAWMSATNQSVVQHLKMMVWPWLLILFPMDAAARRCWNGQTSTFYMRCISKSSWLTLCMAEILSMLTAMMIIAVFFAIFFYAGNEELAVDVVIFLVAVVIGVLLRLRLMRNRDTQLAWLAFCYLLIGMIWFFTYFSYSENVYEGYWFNPNLHNLTELDN